MRGARGQEKRGQWEMNMGIKAAATVACAMFGGLIFLVPFPLAAQVSDQDLAKIETVVVIYAENRSFDHLYGFFPGANGIANATEEQKAQLDHDGTPLPYLTIFDRGKPDARYPRLPNAPFRIDAPPIGMTPSSIGPNPIHAY